jgi:hypothetical protein
MMRDEKKNWTLVGCTQCDARLFVEQKERERGGHNNEKKSKSVANERTLVAVMITENVL